MLAGLALVWNAMRNPIARASHDAA
jgi:hypothetical protein